MEAAVVVRDPGRCDKEEEKDVGFKINQKGNFLSCEVLPLDITTEEKLLFGSNPRALLARR